MPSAPLVPILRQLRRLAAGSHAGHSDADLLDRFVRSHDEIAFEEVVRRHGPLVWGVCTRLLRDRHAAEDAFQATFLVLSPKAGCLSRPDAVGCWLYGVARRVAGRLRGPSLPVVQPLPDVPDPAVQSPLDVVSGHELTAFLDDELGRLPERLRAPLVLCYLEGRTRDEAAARLGWALGTLKRRLEHGRNVLRARLERRGVGLPAALLAIGTACAPVPFGLTVATAQGASAYAVGGLPASSAAAVAEAIVQGMAPTRLKWAVGVLLIAGTVATGAGLVPRQTPIFPLSTTAPAGQPPPAQDTARVDLYGDPLPPGAIARLGTTRFRHDWELSAVAVSPDGKLVAGAGLMNVTLWEAATGRVVRHLPGRVIEFDGGFSSIGFRCVAFSPDGSKVAAGVGGVGAGPRGIKVNNPIYLWDVATGQELRTFDGHPGEVYAVAFVDGGKTLVSLGGEQGDSGSKTLSQWNLETGQVLRTFIGHSGKLTSLAVSPDGAFLTAGSDKNGDTPASVWAWDVATGAQRYRREAAAGSVRSLAYSADGRTLALLDGRSICLWEPATGRELRRWDSPPGDDQRTLRFTPEGRSLVTAGRNTTVRLWDITTGREVRAFQSPRSAAQLVFTDPNTLLGMVWNSTPWLWDLTTNKEVRRSEGHDLWSFAVAWSSDGRTAVTVGVDALRCWDVRTSREVFHTSPETGNYTCAAFSPDGRAVAAGSSKGMLALIDPRNGKTLRRFAGNQEAVHQVFFSAAGDRLVSYDRDEKIRIWDVNTVQEQRALPAPMRGNNPVALAPDGRTVAAAANNSITLYDTATGQQMRTLSYQRNQRLAYPMFSPDGRLLTAGAYGEIVLWETETGQEVLRFSQRSQVTGLCFAHDGRTLATGTDGINGGNYRVRLWDVGTGTELRSLSGHRYETLAVAFSPDGRSLLSCSWDRTALLWDVADVTRRQSVGLSGEDYDRLWGDLAGDAKASHKAVYALAAAGPHAVADLARRLQPVAAAATPVNKLLADLDSDRFTVREEAMKALERLGPAIEMELRKALEGQPSAEARSRIERLLDGWQFPRQRRTIAVLEAIGTPEAREVLRRLANGAPGATLTREAKAALDRLERVAAPR
jgi:RNA polymerase sigma factor (sigma-70 family)